MVLQACSPGKLILSGEHAVVQGCPALAMAVNLEAEVQLYPHTDAVLRIHLPNREPKDFPLEELPELLRQTQQQHEEYLAGKIPFADTVQEPEVLLAVCAAMLKPSSGAKLVFASNLPLGAGLGSSAAFILALLKSLRPDLHGDELRKRAVQGENFQHGRSSGLDVAVSLHGGLLHFENGIAAPLPLAHPLPPFRVYHSGSPLSNTGECVDQSRRVFADTPFLPEAFRSCTDKTLEALLTSDADKWFEAVKENHYLLCKLGVVPDAVQKTISALEESGRAAKVCGAGSVRGDAAGIVMVTGAGPHPVPSSWTELPLQLSLEGTRLIL